MCLILFAYKVVPGIPLIVAANRDEWFHRPTSPAAFWPDQPHILAGRDLKAGGTWLGISTTGRFAALTNFRNPTDRRPDAPSRGALASDFLGGEDSAFDFVNTLARRADPYNGFCMLAGDTQGLYFFSNRGDGVTAIEPGIHGLSNHLLDTPWPKVFKGKAALGTLLERPHVINDYLDMMDDSVPVAERIELPSTENQDWESSLSSMRIMKGDYGTRCSTALRLQSDGRAEFSERTYRREGDIEGQVSFKIAISAWQDAKHASFPHEGFQPR
jgi:uncharacterized protein with NRDE domain